MKSEAYLNEIRTSNGLRRAVLKKLVVEGSRVVFYLVTDLTYRQQDVDFARDVSKKYVPEGYEADVDVMKSVPSAEGVSAKITGFLKEKFPAAAAFLSPADVEVSIGEAGGAFAVTFGDEEYARIPADELLNALAAELSRSFCGSWTGRLVKARREAHEIEHEAPLPAEVILAPRVFPVEEFCAIDGAEGKTALCIADLKGEMAVTVCGELVHFEERAAKNGKIYFRFTVRDGSGVLTASYFPKKATAEKVRALQAGTSVCLTGVNELFNGSFRFTASKIDLGRPPKDYEFRKTYRPVPAAYVAVRPEPTGDLVQADLFGGTELPESFRAGSYVVFDLETTGLSHTPVGGVMDRIIEIGAVKIVNGSISEKFSSFVACPVRLTDEIKQLTGIDDAMLEGAPAVKDVLADFYKFCEGCDLVAHNMAFDSSFIRFYGEEEGYLFNHRQYDTVEFAREVLVLGNYKLNTLADYFHFEFRHHRAFDDAFVTAKIFIELVRKRGGLPKPFASF